jgi:dynein heavy chain 2
VSQQIQVIQAAIKEKTPAIELLGKPVDVNFNAGVFVTLNPAGKGYGGRSKLPDNLKQLFRPVAMSAPDNELIAEVILYSEGFMTAKELGREFVAVFSLAAQLLSAQQHYDWGLRAMKACLTTGGYAPPPPFRLRAPAFASLYSALLPPPPPLQLNSRDLPSPLPLLPLTNSQWPHSSRQADGPAHDPESETELLIKAVRVNTLSKLTFEDASRFLGIVADVFPGIKSQDISNKELEAAIADVMASKAFRLEHDPEQVRKMLQLKESLDQRMGCVIVGPSGCGKSALWRVLQAALIRTGQAVVTHVMNPKSMPRARLLGEMDHDTRRWTDGVLTAAARQVVKEPLNVRSWIVCDGDVDPEWIESLNSVLDDNHLLTLPNGERISFGANVNFLFETHDLRFASPATISRMGMIFLSDDDVDVRRIVKCWLVDQPPEAQAALGGWMEDYFHRALQWVRALPRGLMVDTTLVGTVLNGLSHVTGVRTRAEFALGLVRGLGGNLDLESRARLATEVFGWTGERPADPSAPLDCVADGGALKPLVPGTRAGGELTRADVLAGAMVPTVAVQRTVAMVQGWMDRMEPFILVGPEGAGKTMVVQALVAARRSTSLTVLHCNAQTTAEHVIQKIRQACALFSSNTGPHLTAPGRRPAGAVPQGHQPAQARQVRHVRAHRLPAAAADLQGLLRREARVPGH